MGLLDDVEVPKKKHWRAIEAKANQLLKVKKVRRGKKKAKKASVWKMKRDYDKTRRELAKHWSEANRLMDKE